MRKIYKELEKDQIEREVIFLSQLKGSPKVHEVTEQDLEEDPIEANATIKRLLEDSFFDNSPFKGNIIRANDKIKRLYNLK
jgi:hypothetical protein